MSAECLSESGDELLVAIRVTPRSPRQRIEAVRGGRLIVRVNAPPADGEANTAVRKLIAKHFGVPQSRVRIARGDTSRDKVIAISGIGMAEGEKSVEGLKPA